jgi:replicative DNA helicase
VDGEQSVSATDSHDAAAERAVLRLLLTDSDSTALAQVRRRLQVEDFYVNNHRSVYSAVIALDEAGEPVESVAVGSRLRNMPWSGEPPALFLSELLDLNVASTSLTFYVEAVKEHAARRSVALLGVRAQQLARESGDTQVGEVIEVMRSTLDSIALERVDDDIPQLADILGGTLQEVQQLQSGGGVRGVPSGFTDLDRKLLGFKPGQMITLAARPGLGKSAFALDIARHAAIRQNKGVLVFSLEMSRLELGMRALAAEAYVDSHRLSTKEGLTPSDWEKLQRAAERMGNAKLGIDDDATVTIADIRAKAKTWAQTQPLDLIVIDYLQLMTPVVRSPSRQQEVSEISRAVKLLAKELECPVIALSQLNRGPETRTDKRPVISDLRESGSIEQDSDIVLLLHREDAYDPESPRAGTADCIIAKHRAGGVGEVELAFLGPFCRFENVAR